MMAIGNVERVEPAERVHEGVAIGAAPLGMLHVGVLAEWFGAGPAVAIIQGSVETKVKADRSLLDVIHEEYMGLSRQAVAERRQTIDPPGDAIRH